jgi:hypothetical protein
LAIYFKSYEVTGTVIEVKVAKTVHGHFDVCVIGDLGVHGLCHKNKVCTSFLELVVVKQKLYQFVDSTGQTIGGRPIFGPFLVGFFGLAAWGVRVDVQPVHSRVNTLVHNVFTQFQNTAKHIRSHSNLYM